MFPYWDILGHNSLQCRASKLARLSHGFRIQYLYVVSILAFESLRVQRGYLGSTKRQDLTEAQILSLTPKASPLWQVRISRVVTSIWCQWGHESLYIFCMNRPTNFNILHALQLIDLEWQMTWSPPTSCPNAMAGTYALHTIHICDHLWSFGIIWNHLWLCTWMWHKHVIFHAPPCALYKPVCQ